MTTVESWINYTWITINVVYHFISENYKEIISELKVLGDSTYNISLVQKAATDTTLCHYGLSQCSTLSEARVILWERKMARNAFEPPKLCSLPPTDTSFKENVLRAHLAAAIMKRSLDSDPPNLNPEQYWWYTPEGFDFLLPVVTPEGTDMAPPALIKLVKCGCKSQSPCSNNKCSCKQNSLRCTFLCICHNGDNCNNKPAVDWFASCILLDQAYIWVTWLIGLIIQKCIELDLLFLKLNISARE